MRQLTKRITAATQAVKQLESQVALVLSPQRFDDDAICAGGGIHIFAQVLKGTATKI